MKEAMAGLIEKERLKRVKEEQSGKRVWYVQGPQGRNVPRTRL